MTQRKISVRAATFLAIASIAALTGCGKSDPVSPINAGLGGYGVPGVGGAPGCLPLQSQIPFTAIGGRVDSANIMAGQLIGLGQIQVGIGGMTAGQQLVSNPMVSPRTGIPKTYVDGTISFTVQSPTAFTGIMQLSPQGLCNAIFLATGVPGPGCSGSYGGSYGYPTTYPTYPSTYPTYPSAYPTQQAACVTGMTVNMGADWQYNYTYGKAYLMMSNSAVIQLQF